jgi:hypothetical protein
MPAISCRLTRPSRNHAKKTVVLQEPSSRCRRYVSSSQAGTVDTASSTTLPPTRNMIQTLFRCASPGRHAPWCACARRESTPGCRRAWLIHNSAPPRHDAALGASRDVLPSRWQEHSALARRSRSCGAHYLSADTQHDSNTLPLRIAGVGEKN